ncbi:hypothetical protein QUF76_06085 [Desulfobacterales bacterium HSG16]|nr:hypothetical protein [Desulfobacterales bacterium HSG16]
MDDVLDLIFSERYQVKYKIKPDINKELSSRVDALMDENKLLKGVLNELKGWMLEFVVHRFQLVSHKFSKFYECQFDNSLKLLSS